MQRRSFLLLVSAALVAEVESQDNQSMIPATRIWRIRASDSSRPMASATASYSNGPYKQAIYLSTDGMHQFDLVRYISTHPNSTWAKIIGNAVVYSNANASSPSDSLPATTALCSGESLRNLGIFWETVYDRSVYPPGSNCTGLSGIVCEFSDAIDLDSSMLDGGGSSNISLLPLQKTSWGTCEIIYPQLHSNEHCL
jgi:hypothetical protein